MFKLYVYLSLNYKFCSERGKICYNLVSTGIGMNFILA